MGSDRAKPRTTERGEWSFGALMFVNAFAGTCNAVRRQRAECNAHTEASGTPPGPNAEPALVRPVGRFVLVWFEAARIGTCLASTF